MTQMLQPQEIEVFYILPTIRHYLAESMKNLGFPQKKIAELLHIRESTVSQYINNKRGSKIVFNEEIKQEIKNSARKINKKEDLLRETQRILMLVRASGTLCEIHKKFSDISGSCKVDVVGCV